VAAVTLTEVYSSSIQHMTALGNEWLLNTYPEKPLIPLRRFVLTESLQTFHQQQTVSQYQRPSIFTSRLAAYWPAPIQAVAHC